MFLKSISTIYKFEKNKEIETENYFFGVLITLIIYFSIYMSYKYSDSAIALGAYFVFPFYMILIPYTIANSIKKSNDIRRLKVKQCLLISVISSSIFIVIFYKYTFGIIEYLGLDKVF